jgi:hypothetical protein
VSNKYASERLSTAKVKVLIGGSMNDELVARRRRKNQDLKLTHSLSFHYKLLDHQARVI